MLQAVTPSALLSAARVPRRAVSITKERLHELGVTGMLLAGPDEGGAWRTSLALEPMAPGQGQSQGGGVGIITIEGALEQRAQMGLCEAYVDGYDAIESRYDAAIAAYKRGEISRIVTVINSPGGMREGAFATTRRVRAKIEKAGIPTIAVADECVCSAAWAWAVVSDQIFAPEDARVSSIGAVVIAKSMAGKLEQEGIEVRVYRSGERKMRPSGVEPFTPEDDAELQRRADGGGEMLAQWTAERRGKRAEDYLALQGAVFNGREALQLGLIDGIKTAYEVVEMALNDAARAEMAEALGLSASASQADIDQRLAEMKTATEQLSTVKAELAKVEAQRIAEQAKAEAEQRAQVAAQARATFAAEVKAACDAALILPPTEAQLLAHYDRHGEASARDALSLAKSPTAIVPKKEPGAAPQVSGARLTDFDRARAKQLGMTDKDYAAMKYGEEAPNA